MGCFFECEHCDREFTTDEDRLAHQKAEHQPKFECRNCDHEFTTVQARDAHQKAKHSMFECHYCDRELNSEEARQQHEDAKHHENATHLTFECHYCDRELSSEGARQQHENAKHHSEPLRFGSLSSNSPKLAESDAKESSTSDVSQRTDEESESPASPSRSSDSTLDKGELYHSTSGFSSTDAPGEGAAAERPCPCTHSLEHGMCSICQQTFSLLSNTDKPVLDDTGIKDDSVDLRRVIFHCTPCLKVFETEEAFRDHVCAFRAAMFRPHCTVCYTQFDDESSLQKHLEGLQAFSCHLCLTRCCSDEMLQDHMLSHPTCGKCDKSFADNLALCLVRIFRSHDQFINEHCQYSLTLNLFDSMWDRTTRSWSVGIVMALLSRRTVSNCITRTLSHTHPVHSVALARETRPIWTRFV